MRIDPYTTPLRQPSPPTSLERAVALDRPWAYIAPLAAGAGALAGLAGAPASFRARAADARGRRALGGAH